MAMERLENLSDEVTEGWSIVRVDEIGLDREQLRVGRIEVCYM